MSYVIGTPTSTAVQRTVNRVDVTATCNPDAASMLAALQAVLALAQGQVLSDINLTGIRRVVGPPVTLEIDFRWTER
jgi:hypothetical protein